MSTLTTYIGTKIIQAMPHQHADGRDGYQVVYEDGYTSWSPKDVFDRAYRKTDAMTFGDALIMLEAGKMVKRPNGRPIMLLGDASSAVPMLLNPPEFREDDDECATVEFDLHDMLAKDWQVVE